MRISDWSSDVCSSDLVREDLAEVRHLANFPQQRHRIRRGGELSDLRLMRQRRQRHLVVGIAHQQQFRARWARVEALQQALRVAKIEILRSEEHTSELQSLMRISSAVFCLKKKKQPHITTHHY